MQVLRTDAARDVGVMPCQTTDPEVFQDREHQRLAKSLCAGCDLKRACRRYARTHREWGTWGGETNEERAAAGYLPRGSTKDYWQRRSVLPAS
ncbi:WhiB family transcriptional regulator [Streptomyces sp. NPDC001668]|uniref:WhiB family transcriptional regulator n=1 Tax=Streptomyces sp. NPDC001668 TaxID=3364598 RepID=UPI00368A29EE